MFGICKGKLTIGYFLFSLVIMPMLFAVSAFLPSGYAYAGSYDQAPPGTEINIDSQFACSWNSFSLKGCAVQGFKVLFVDLPSWVFMGAGMVFDTVMALSFSSTLIKNASFVDAGWVVCRDIANTFFIFILLYIAILTILQSNTSQTRQMLASLIVTALLMNFSLYATRFVIDVGNVFGLEFYTKIGDVVPDPFVEIKDVSVRNISASFAQAINIQKTIDGSFMFNTSAGPAIFVFFMIGIMLIIATYAFLVASFLFLSRIIVFWLCMIFSPLAFFSWAYEPLKGKIWGPWKSYLFNATFMPTIFLFFVYLIMRLAIAMEAVPLFTSSYVSGSVLAELFNTIMVVFLNYLVIIGLLLYALNKTIEMGGKVGGYFNVGGAVKGAAGVGVGAGLGAVAIASRQTIGRTAQMISDSRFGKGLEESKIGRLAKSGLEATAGASFNLANVSRVQKLAQKGGVSILGGQTAGYSAQSKEKQEMAEKLIKQREAAGDYEGAAKILDSFSTSTTPEVPFNVWKKKSIADRLKWIDKLPEGRLKEQAKDMNKRLVDQTIEGVGGLGGGGELDKFTVRGNLSLAEQKIERKARAEYVLKNEKKTGEEKLAALESITDAGMRKELYMALTPRERKILASAEKEREAALQPGETPPINITDAIKDTLNEDEKRKISRELAVQEEEDKFEENKKSLGTLEQAAVTAHTTDINSFIQKMTDGTEKESLKGLIENYDTLEDKAKAENALKIEEALQKMKGNNDADDLLNKFSIKRSEAAKTILDAMKAKDVAKLSPDILKKQEVSEHLHSEALSRIVSDSEMVETDKDAIISNIIRIVPTMTDEKRLSQLGQDKISKKYLTKEQRDLIEARLEVLQGLTPTPQQTNTPAPSPIILPPGYTPKPTPPPITSSPIPQKQNASAQNNPPSNNNP